jgi:hypothetical protein
VARVCKNDTGGRHKFHNSWTTFLKSRLNCSVPGDIPFYFDEIQSVHIDKDVVYALFTTPDNAISGSAICKFDLKDIRCGELNYSESCCAECCDSDSSDNFLCVHGCGYLVTSVTNTGNKLLPLYN